MCAYAEIFERFNDKRFIFLDFAAIGVIVLGIICEEIERRADILFPYVLRLFGRRRGRAFCLNRAGLRRLRGTLPRLGRAGKSGRWLDGRIAEPRNAEIGVGSIVEIIVIIAVEQIFPVFANRRKAGNIGFYLVGNI